MTDNGLHPTSPYDNAESNGRRDHIVWKMSEMKSGERYSIDPAGLLVENNTKSQRSCNIFVKYLKTELQKEGMKIVLQFLKKMKFSITVKHYPFNKETKEIIEELKDDGFDDVTFESKKFFEYSYRLIEIFNNGESSVPKLSILCDRDFCEIVNANANKKFEAIRIIYFKYNKIIESTEMIRLRNNDWKRGFLITSESKISGYTIEKVLNENIIQKSTMNLGDTANLTILYIIEESQIWEIGNIILTLYYKHGITNFNIKTLLASRKYCHQNLEGDKKADIDDAHLIRLTLAISEWEYKIPIRITFEEIPNRRVTKFNCIEFPTNKLRIVLNEGVQLHLEKDKNLARPHIILFLFNDDAQQPERFN